MSDNNNIIKIKQCFSDALKVSPEQIVDDLSYNSIPTWDSVAHMALITQLESSFDIMLDTDDIIDMSSYAKALQILSKYDIQF